MYNEQKGQYLRYNERKDIATCTKDDVRTALNYMYNEQKFISLLLGRDNINKKIGLRA